MGQGYVRNDVSNNIANGNTASAADIDGEFDSIVAAFASSTGHTHDGTTAEGGPITLVGPAQEVVVTATTIEPATDNTVDLGSASKEFKDAYIDGTLNADVAVINDLTVDTAVTFSGATVADLGTVTTADIDGGTLDGVTIGGSTPAAGTFTDLTATGDLDVSGIDNASTVRTDLGLAIGTDVQAYDAELEAIAGLTSAADRLPYFTGSGTASLATFTSAGRALIDDASASAQRTTLGLGTIATQAANNVDIDGGAIDGTIIGGSSAAAGTFTTVHTSGNVGVKKTDPAVEVDVAGSINLDRVSEAGDNTTNYVSFISNRTTSDAVIGGLKGVWGSNEVANIVFETGDDTSNKDDGIITFNVSEGGSLAEAGRVEQDGSLVWGNDITATGLNLGNETMDTYDEGSWTPVVTDGTNNATLSTALGTYTKIGRIVHFGCACILTSKGSISGNMKITGLPFSTPSGLQYQANGMCQTANVTIASGKSVGWVLNQNDDELILIFHGGTLSNLTSTELASNSVIYLNGTMVAA